MLLQVLLVHGFPEFWFSWLYQFKPLSDAGFQVVALDCRGYGWSSKPSAVSEYSMQKVADDVIAVADAAAPGQKFTVVSAESAVQCTSECGEALKMSIMEQSASAALPWKPATPTCEPIKLMLFCSRATASLESHHTSWRFMRQSDTATNGWFCSLADRNRYAGLSAY